MKTIGARTQTEGKEEEIGKLLNCIDDLSGAELNSLLAQMMGNERRVLTDQSDDSKRELLRRLLQERIAKPARVTRPKACQHFCPVRNWSAAGTTAQGQATWSCRSDKRWSGCWSR